MELGALAGEYGKCPSLAVESPGLTGINRRAPLQVCSSVSPTPPLCFPTASHILLLGTKSVHFKSVNLEG